MTPRRSPPRSGRRRPTATPDGRATAPSRSTGQPRRASPMRSKRRRRRRPRPISNPPIPDQRRTTVSSATDKAKGAANEAIGKAKQGVGKAVGSDRMKGEGALQEAKGDLQQAVGKTKDAVKKAVDKA